WILETTVLTFNRIDTGIALEFQKIDKIIGPVPMEKDFCRSTLILKGKILDIHMVQKTKSGMGVDFIKGFLGAPNDRKFSDQRIRIGQGLVLFDRGKFIGYP